MSEFREDLISGDWMIIAAERAKRPDAIPDLGRRKIAPKQGCPFENLEKSGNWPPIIVIPDRKNWRVVVIPNKFPALEHTPQCGDMLRHGPYNVTEGSGHHDLAITRDHYKNFAHISPKVATELFEILQKRYQMLAEDRCLLYAAMIANWGSRAGATLFHPHYQIFTLPIIPPHVAHSLAGSERYYKKNKKCPHCVMIAGEKKEKNRVIGENRHAIAYAPYASRMPFQVYVSPKKHYPYFEKTPHADIADVAAMLQLVMRNIEKNLHDPDLNFFIHSSPLKDQKQYKHYHWHIEVVPKITILGGFELSTGIDINIFDPDKAAKILRGKK